MMAPISVTKVLEPSAHRAAILVSNKGLEVDGISVNLRTGHGLLARFLAGDRDAFSEIYQDHHAAIFRFALNMTGDRAEAGELTQDVFVWLIHHSEAYDPGRGELGAFLIGVARKLLLKKRRDARRWLPLFDLLIPRHAPPPDPTRGIDIDYLRKAIALLPVRYREVVVLCDLEGKNYDEAAAILNCAVGTIRSRLHRGRELLTRKMQPGKEKI